MNLTRVIKKIPVASDYYSFYWCFWRQGGCFRGVFKTFDEATRSLPKNTRVSHNQPEIHKHPEISQLTAWRDLEQIEFIDYPVIAWLKSVLLDGPTIFDLGGNVGVSYYAYKKHLDYPENLRYIVCDLPEIIKAGKNLAETVESQGLSFTLNFADAEGANALLTSGTLQFIEPSLADLLKPLEIKPKHILINHVPFYDGEEFVTLQNIGYAFSPYKIQNRADFLGSLANFGYELVDSWQINRTCSIPFHPERFVNAYHGFYLRLRQEEG